ncbi:MULTISPECIES: MMPL family transporter [unclassified Amycolatopsis]|uniref:MMPL family transporter n=1 Tax=unclassified Amycolatopsis TaxID=2618356 RepID=UPI002874CBF7|nr:MULTISPECIES: MMPL family transporter [unclassified Amycolatopsis]MDS0137270.1 MMPL family transporter [Amycolatopsis sp. 505]MDS0141465.1 MMPL family transporter [Amycolatopsis sp. CM201R]
MDTITRTSGGGLARLAGWAQRHRWLAVALWALVLIGVTFTSQLAGSAFHDDNSLPGTESQQVVDLLENSAQSGTSAQIVLKANSGLAANRSSIDTMLGEVRSLPHVRSVTETTLSPDGRIGYATVTFDAASTDLPYDDIVKFADTTKRAGPVEVALAGDPIERISGGGGPAEGVGLLAALVILVFLFRSLLAAGLPVITAVFAVGSTLGVITVVSHFVDIASYTSPLMMLVGFGVGVDYALLIFSRYRTEILAGHDREPAARRALDTAGRSVLFAGTTVIIALLGLLALGLGGLRGVALSVALTVLMTMLASVTLLPALLSLFGKRLERGIRRQALRKEPGKAWRRLADSVQRRPLAPLALGLIVLIGLSIPAAGMRLGFADASTDPAGSPTRKAYDLLAEGFGPGFTGPLAIVTEDGDTGALQQKLASTPGIAQVLPPMGRTVLVFPTTSPQDEATADLVTRLRTEVLPTLPGHYLVGGSVAAATDFADAVADRLPLFVLVVVGLSALLLMVVFRSVLIPLKAALLNLLSIGASLGVMTLVFGDGWFGAQPGPIEAFVPVMIFAIVFGLSMDYEVFLVSRMHEEWRRTGNAQLAVREGLASTGAVITAAGAIMVLVFGAFLLDPSRMLAQFGLGLAVAVLLDALVIRCLVVPAIMRLLGARAWWLPKWLDRRLPHFALEP